MKVLIAYTSAGVGHRRAAEAIYDYLKANHKEMDTRIIDSLDYTNSLFKLIYSKGYSFIIARLHFQPTPIDGPAIKPGGRACLQPSEAKTGPLQCSRKAI